METMNVSEALMQQDHSSQLKNAHPHRNRMDSEIRQSSRSLLSSARIEHCTTALLCPPEHPVRPPLDLLGSVLESPGHLQLFLWEELSEVLKFLVLKAVKSRQFSMEVIFYIIIIKSNKKAASLK